MVKKIYFGLGVAALLVAGCKGGDAVPNTGTDVLAVVNGQSIPMSQYYTMLERSSVVTAMVNPQSLNVDPKTGGVPTQISRVQIEPALPLQVLRDAVNTAIVNQLAKADGVYPSDDAVNKEIEFQQSMNQNFVKNMNDQGLTVPQIKEMVATDLAKFGLLTKGVTVTSADVDDFIKNNPQQFTDPERASLIMIEVPDEAKKKLVDDELKTGQMFSAVAQHYSVQPNGKALNYRFPETDTTRFSVPLRTLIAKTKEFNSTSWEFDSATKHYVKFYVERKAPAKKMNIDANMKERVRRSLLVQKGQNANDLDKRINEALRSARIEVKLKYLQEPWKQAFENLVKSTAPATTDKPATKPAGN